MTRFSLYCRGLVEMDNSWDRVECVICNQASIETFDDFSQNLPSADFVIQEQGLNISSKTV